MAGNELFAREEWRRHGANVPACLAGMMLVSVHNYSLGAMVMPLEKEFGWSRAEITAGHFFPSLAAIIMAPLVGMAIDRVGARRIALAGVPAFCLCLALLGLAGPGLTSWLVLYFLLGVASMLIFPTVWTTAINVRFDRNRGKALAVTLIGTGVAATFVPTLTTLLIASQGWRGAYATLALLAFVIVFPLVWLLFARDERGGAAQLAGDDAVGPALHGGKPMLSELRSARFLKLAGAAFAFGLAASALTTNAVPILRSEGLDALAAAKIAGLMGIGSMTGRLLGGVLLDHMEARIVAACSMILPAIAILLLLNSDGAALPASLACLLIGLSAGAEYDACAYLAARHFGVQRFGALFGTIGGILLAANGIAPTLSNRVFDIARSYDIVLWASLPLLVLSAILFFSLGAYPESEKSAG
ncbi:MAG: MFS transporter [Novosphingobium sp.]